MNPITSLFSGSILGIFGAVGTGVLEYFKDKQKMAHELNVLAAQKDIAQVTATSQVMLEKLKNLSASFEADKSAYWQPGAPISLLVVEVARGMTRPVITFYFTVLASYVAVFSVNKIGLSTAIMERVAEYSIYSCLELAGICIGWWFGSRGLQRISSSSKK